MPWRWLVPLVVVVLAAAQLGPIRTDECRVTVSNHGLYILQTDYMRFQARTGYEDEEESKWLLMYQNATYFAIGTSPFQRRSMNVSAVLGRSAECSVPSIADPVCSVGVSLLCSGTTLIGFRCRYTDWPRGRCYE